MIQFGLPGTGKGSSRAKSMDDATASNQGETRQEKKRKASLETQTEAEGLEKKKQAFKSLVILSEARPTL